MILALAALLSASCIFWLKANARLVWGLDWSPWRWWLLTSWATNLLVLYGWWRLVPLVGVWRAAALWSTSMLLVDLVLHSVFYGPNLRGALGLVLCTAGLLLAR